MPHIRAKFKTREPIDTRKYFTFITLVRYHEGKSQKDLENYLNKKMVKREFRRTIKINLVVVTWGAYDSVFIWETSDFDFAKRFRDDNQHSTTVGQFTTLCASKSDGW